MRRNVLCCPVSEINGVVIGTTTTNGSFHNDIHQNHSFKQETSCKGQYQRQYQYQNDDCQFDCEYRYNYFASETAAEQQQHL